MHEISITIPASIFKTFPPEVKNAILSRLTEDFRLSENVSGTPENARGNETADLAQLEIHQAKAFLNNCSDKSIAILQDIVDQNGEFLMSFFAKKYDVSFSGLRGAWGGLTKRTRTITKDPKAKFIEWFKVEDDWRGLVSQQTIKSMRAALEQRR